LSLEAEYEVADLIAQMVPAAELVRFSNSGTEAVMAALRLARAYTKRDSYIIIEGSYHGFFDAAMWRADVESWIPGEAGAPRVVPYGSGIPQQTRQLLHVAPLNDADVIEQILKAHGPSIAALLIEPIMGNCCSIAATPDYIRDIRRLCDEHGVLLVVDEIKTGFRIGRGGAQAHYGVGADICTFAKAMANGYPIAALAGRAEIMRTINWNEVAHGGTYTAHPVALFAAAETLAILRDTDVLERISAYGERLRLGMSEILGRHGIAHCFSGPPAMSGLLFAETPPTSYREWKASDFSFYNRLAAALHDHGVLCEPDSREPWFICGAHDETCLADTLERFEGAVRAAREARRAV
jgi:glutamate-1-semialdehyde 2,1-aminomutase